MRGIREELAEIQPCGARSEFQRMMVWSERERGFRLFILDGANVILLTPTIILWSLIFLAYLKSLQLPAKEPPRITSRWRGDRALALANEITFRPAQVARLKIYGVSLTLAAILQTTFISLNFWHAPMLFNETFRQSGLITIAYQLLSLALVLPLFYRLQVALNCQIVADSASVWYRIQPKVQLILFCSIAPILLSLFEVVRISTGFSTVPVWLANDLITLSSAFTCIPSAILGLTVAFYLHKRNYAKNIRRDELGLYRDYLKEENFNISLLEGKTDEEISKIIDVAHYVGELEKADLMSRVLLERHL